MAGAAPNSTASDPTTAASAGSIATGVGIALAVTVALIFFVIHNTGDGSFDALGALRETRRPSQKHPRGLDSTIVNSFPISQYFKEQQPRSTHADAAVEHRSSRSPSIDEEAGGRRSSSSKFPRPFWRRKGLSKLTRLWVQMSRSSLMMLGRPHHIRKPRQESTCPICTEDFTDGIEVKKLPCRHLFHPTCVDQWLTEFGVTCPVWQVMPFPTHLFQHTIMGERAKDGS